MLVNTGKQTKTCRDPGERLTVHRIFLILALTE